MSVVNFLNYKNQTSSPKRNRFASKQKGHTSLCISPHEIQGLLLKLS